MSAYEWRERMREHSRLRRVKRLKFPKRDETEERLRALQALRDWGIIDEAEFRERRRALADIGARIRRTDRYRRGPKRRRRWAR